MKVKNNPARFLFNVLAAALLCGNAAAATSPANASVTEARFADAMDLYSVGKWSAAYGRFAALADQGHAEAARIALLMLRYGAKMYGHDWGASQPQIDHWITLAVQRMETLKAEAGD